MRQLGKFRPAILRAKPPRSPLRPTRQGRPKYANKQHFRPQSWPIGKASRGFRLGNAPIAAEWGVFQIELRALGAFSYLQMHRGNGDKFQVHPAPPFSLKHRWEMLKFWRFCLLTLSSVKPHVLRLFTCQFQTEENAGSMPRHARHEYSAGL
jgi:hypothetical protein